MTRDEMERLADLVEERIGGGGRWLPLPTRPEPPGRPAPGALPAWSGAAQGLKDVAPLRRATGVIRHRPEYPALVVAARQAAAARGPSPLPSGSAAGAARPLSVSSRREVPIGVSNRHLHLSQADLETLFGKGQTLSLQRAITQPGQFAAAESVNVAGPAGRLEGVRIVGPARGATQLELAPSDCRRLGIEAPVLVSGRLEASGGGVVLEGTAGSVKLEKGVIVAQRHLHVAPADAGRLRVADGDRVAVECGGSGRRALLHEVVVRMGSAHATELHLDRDEADALGVRTGDVAAVVSREAPLAAGRGARRLLTERGIAELAARGEVVRRGGPWLLTPAAVDRARALGVWRE
jgi:putative phosphotransacetylase